MTALVPLGYSDNFGIKSFTSLNIDLRQKFDKGAS